MTFPGPTVSAIELAVACRNGDRRAASRLISMLESQDASQAQAASEAVSQLPLPPHTIGITGPPGAGKSSLLDYCVKLYRDKNLRVAVLAVDPSSPFTGGALLGDRIRMSSHRNDSGVFIRSMGSRGASGGLAAAASDALRVLGGAGCDKVFLETVGAGQAETEVVNLADTVCVVQVPGLGDEVQLMKMGILELADIFVVNKADKPEAESLKVQIEIAVHESPDQTNRVLRQLGRAFATAYTGTPWIPPVVLISALHRTNGDALIDACEQHLAFLKQPEIAAPLKRNRLAREVVWRAGRRFQEILAKQLEPGGKWSGLIDRSAAGAISLDAVVAQILKNE
jgi:LAO/AO transport system kinase